MLELLLLVLRTLVAAVRSRRDVALENLALRHQVEVPLRTNPHSRLRGHDRREVGALRVVSRSPWVVSSRLGAGHERYVPADSKESPLGPIWTCCQLVTLPFQS